MQSICTHVGNTRFIDFLRKGLFAAALSLSASVPVLAQVADFNVTVNTGPNPPNGDTVYPGEATSVRVTLANNNIVTSLTGVNFTKALPTTASNGLIVIGTSAINGDPGCIGGTLTTSAGASGVSLVGLTVPPRRLGFPGSGECYLDIPIAAFSIDGGSGSLAYSLNAGDVNSDQGTNATGGPQAYTLRPSNRPTWSKSFSANNIHVLGGATRTMTITINNNDSNVPLSGITFFDQFPTAGGQGATIEPTGTVGGTCGGTTMVSQGPMARVDVSGVSLMPSSSCTITVETRARHSAGIYTSTTTNTIPATGFRSDQGLRPAANASSQVRARSPLAVGKSFSPGIVASGQANTFTVTLTNSGLTALPITTFTDDPIAAAPNQANMTIANAGDVANSCAGGTVTLESGGQGFNVGGFSIPAGGNCVITVTYTAITPGADQPSTYTNSIGQGDVQTGTPGIVSQARSATVLVADRLRVLKSAAPANATAGDPVRYTITLQNYSASILNDVSVLDVLPNGATFLIGGVFDPTLTPACGSLGLNGASQGDSSLNFTIPTQPARTGTNTPGTCVINFSAMLDPDGTTDTTNIIPAGNVCFGVVPTCNNVASGGATTNNTATMSLAKTFDNAESVSKTEGLTTRLRLVLSNNSVSLLSSATISDTLPSAGPFQQLRVANPPNVSNSCGGSVIAAAGSTSVEMNGGTVPATSGGSAGTCSLEVDVVGPAGVYPNTAAAAAVRNNADGSTTDVNDSDGANLTYNDALRVEKFFNPSSTGDGGSSTGSVRFTNLDSSGPITGISMTDNLPAGMLIAEPANAYSTCGGNPALTADPGTTAVFLNGATLAPSAVCEVRFDVSVTGNTDWVNTIPAGEITADNGITNRGPVTATLTFVPPEIPLISKAISPGNISPGQSALLTINITNAAQDLTNLELTDYFTIDGSAGAALNGMRLASAPAPSTDCPSGIVTAMPGDTSVRLSGASLPANASCQVRVNVTSTSAGTITNTIPINSIRNDQGATNSTSFAQTTLNIGTAIGVSKMFEPTVVSPNEPSRLRITIYNTQSEGLTGLSLTDTFPTGLVTAVDPQGFSDCGGGVVITFPTPDSVLMTGGSIGGAAGDEAATCVIEADVVAATEDTYLNSIPENSLLANGNPVPHPEANAKLEVRQRLIVNKAFDDLTLDMGDPNGFTTGTASRLPGVAAPLTIRIENPNAIALSQVRFVDELPDGLTLAPTPNLATTCTGGAVDGVAFGRELRLTGATLDATGGAGAVCTVTASVVSNISGIYTNEIAVGEVTSFEGIDNNPPTQAQIIIITPPGITKDIAPPVVAPGVPATLTLVMENDNDLAYTLTAPLADNLPGSPGQMTVANSPSVTTDCPDGPGIVTAVADASGISIANGASVPPGGCSVTVDVTATTPGDYLNFIPVGALNTSFGPNEEPAEAPLMVSTLGYISGRVFLDNQASPNGSYLPGDSTPIGGNLIELRSGGGCSGALINSVVTDAMGNYLFSGLAAGTYSVCQPAQPNGSLNSVTTQGAIVGVAGSTGSVGTPSNPGTPTSQIAGIVLGNNGNADEVSGSPENNFSEVLPASIDGNVYYDANNNGIFDPSENGIGGVTVTLTGPVNTSVITNSDGSYNFTGLPPGQYTVVETQPSPWNDGIDTLGTVDGIPNGNNSTNNSFTAIRLAPGDAGIEYNFGELVSAAALAINASATCSNDAPVVNYNIPAYSGSNTTFSLSWYTVDDRLIATLADQPAAGSLLWPGVVLDGAGMGVDWPGWVFSGGEWTAVADDRLPEMVLRVTLGETAETTVAYPRNSASCLTQPLGTFSTPIPALPNPALLVLTLFILLTGVWSLTQQGQRRRL